MSNRRKQLLIETWLDPDPDDFITMHDLYVSALEAMEHIEFVEDESNKFADENEALKKDRERLEWLVDNRARVWLQDGFYDVHNDSGDCIVYMKDSWRDAIDKAMRAN